MKPKKVMAALQGRPWLWKCVGSISGVHSLDYPNSGAWQCHLERWTLRNISEVNVHVHDFKDLNLDREVGLIHFPFPEENNDFTATGRVLRKYCSFVQVGYSLYVHSTYDTEWLKPFSLHYTPGKTPRNSIKDFTRPHYVGTPEKKIENPLAFDAIVRITKVGILGRCSTVILDVYHFPKNFDAKSI